MFRFGIIKSGASPKYIKDNADLLEATKVALPHQKGFIDKYGAASLAYLVEELRERLFKELVVSLQKPDWNVAEWEQATEIVKALDKVENEETMRRAEKVSEAIPNLSNV